MKTLLKILLLFLCFPSISFSQLEFHNWIFGRNYDIDIPQNLTGITFMTESGEPEYLNIQVPNSMDTIKYFDTSEGSAVISDSMGTLLYHTTNYSLIDVVHKTVVIDSNTIIGSGSATQNDVNTTAVVLDGHREPTFVSNTTNSTYGSNVINPNAFQTTNGGMTDGIIARLYYDGSARSKQVFDFSMGKSKSAPAFSIYPNPVRNSLNINLLDIDNPISITIYSSLGSRILELPNYTDMIDISSLVSGTYILELTTNSGKYTRTFIKM